MARPITRIFFFLCFLTFCAARPALADTLRGTVADPQQHPVSGATIIILRANVVILTTKTGRDGTFGPLTLPAGDYDIRVAADGFGAPPARVTLSAGSDTKSVAIALAIRAISEAVVVSSASVSEPLSRVPDSVTVVSRDDLNARDIDTVADAVRSVPGMQVVASGGRGAVTSFFPRGGASNYTLVLVDGIPQNSFGGGFDAAHLGTADLDRVEVVRDPESALFGGGAIGAVVQAVTRAGGPLTGDVSFEGGGYGTTRTAASAAGSMGRWGWGTALERLASAGDTRVFPSIGTRVSNDDYTRTDASGTLAWNGDAGRTWRTTLRGGTNDVGVPGPYGSDPDHLYGGLDTITRDHNRTIEVGTDAVLPVGARVTHRAQFTFADLRGDYTSPYGPSMDRTRRGTGRYQLDLNASAALGVSVGSELDVEHADNTFITDAASTPIPVRRAVWGTFGEARASFGSRAFLTVGARVERIERDALATDGYSRPDFTNDVVWSANPKAAATWFLAAPNANGWTKLHAGAGTGIRPPNAFELAFTNNPNLKPERNVSVDAGIEHALAKQRLVLDATWFHNRYQDLIVTVGSSFIGASRYQTDNIANARAMGVELGAAWRGDHGFGARAAYTWLDSAVLGIDNAPTAAEAPFAVGQPLFRRPRHQGSAELTWAGVRANAFVSMNGRGHTLDLEPNYASSTVLNPGYVVVAAGGGVKIVRDAELFVRADNLFNRAYEEAYGYPALGRTAMVGIRVVGRH